VHLVGGDDQTARGHLVAHLLALEVQLALGDAAHLGRQQPEARVVEIVEENCISCGECIPSFPHQAISASGWMPSSSLRARIGWRGPSGESEPP